VWVNQFALLPRDGGGTRHFEVGRELVARGWDVTVVASDYHLLKRVYTRRADPVDRAPVEEVVDGVRFVWLWAAPYRRNDWRRAHNWLSFGRSVRAAAPVLARADVVIGSSPQLFAATAARALARRLWAPFVLEVRDLWPESLVAAGGRKGLAYQVLAGVADRLYRDAERIVVLAGGTARYLAERGVPRAKLVHVPNGVDVHLMRPAEPAAMPSGGAPADAPPADGTMANGTAMLVYAGAHGPANGLDVVLDAAERLDRAGVRVRFVLVGDGPAKADLVAESARRGLATVEFRDPVPKAQLATLLAAADGGLMLLRDAPLFAFAVSPNKLFDYLAVGLPVVCNVPGEVAELLAESGGGVQAADTGGAALAAAVERLLTLPPDARREMARAGRRWVERTHSREVLGARLDAALSVLAGRDQ
jgi:glycosyltransferase involved in cell wall biosynthesis